MAIAPDFASTSNYEPALSTYNWSHICNGSNRFLIIGVSILVSGTVSSITYNSKNLAFIRADATGVYRSELWSITNPDQGTNTATVNLSGSLTSVAGGASYSGVSQIGALGVNTGNTGTNNPGSVVITNTVKNAYIFNNVATSKNGTTAGGSQTQRWDNGGALGSGGGEDQFIATPGATTMQWTGMGVTDSWAISAVEILPSATD